MPICLQAGSPSKRFNSSTRSLELSSSQASAMAAADRPLYSANDAFITTTFGPQIPFPELAGLAKPGRSGQEESSRASGDGLDNGAVDVDLRVLAVLADDALPEILAEVVLDLFADGFKCRG